MIQAGAKIARGACLAGWSITDHQTAKSGSTYLKLRRADGAKLHIRVADHANKRWRIKVKGRIDSRTQPQDLLVLLRRLRTFDWASPGPPLAPADEIELANNIARDLWKKTNKPRIRRDSDSQRSKS